MFSAVHQGFDAATAWLYRRVPDPSGNADLSDADRRRVWARQIEAVVRMTPALMIGNITCAVSLLVVLKITGQSSLFITIWALAAIAAAVLTLWRWHEMRDQVFPPQASRRTVQRLVGNIALTAMLWTPVGSVVVPTTTGSAQAFAVAMVAGLVAAGTIALYPIPAAAMVYSVTLWLGGMIGFATFGDPTTLGYFLVGVGFLITVARAIDRHSELFVAEFVGRLRLDQQKTVIETLLHATRAEAEEERARAQQRLAQARKMEAIGQLTAGVAHDFNNLLAAIRGHAELLDADADADAGAGRDAAPIQAILRSTRRGADLVSQLLSVGRRQHLEPEPVDLAMLVARMTGLLDRTLDPRIAIHANIEPGLNAAIADPTQLEAAILNLALNARDAMPDGGTLTIACHNADPAGARMRGLGLPGTPHVCIAVRDTGHGMSDQVRDRAIEPFFTTRKFGSASGLGLSSVHGFAEQSRGCLFIDSRVGHGTTVEIYLPATLRAASQRDPARTIPQARGEHILLVDDNADVLRAIRRNLESLGYAVTVARSVTEALERLVERDRPDLVLSEVMLSDGAGGFDLGARLRDGQRIAYMSGFAGATDSRDGADGQAVALLAKPFSRAQLARFVRAQLDRNLPVPAPAPLQDPRKSGARLA